MGTQSISAKRYEPCPRCTARGKDSRGDNLVNFADGGKHCFACGFHIGHGHVGARSSDASGDRINHGTTSLPFDFTREVPATAFKWLLQYGLPWSYWKTHTGYSPKEERLVIAYGSPPVASIGRYLGTEDRPKWRAWGKPNNHPIPFGNPEGSYLVVVEDIISAHKLAYYGWYSLPLFGTNPTKEQIKFFINQKKPILLWLDNDQQAKMPRMRMWLQSITGQPVASLTTVKDPKYYSESEINEWLQPQLES